MKILLIPFDLDQESEARELYGIFNRYFSHAPILPTIEKIMRKDILYYRAFLDDVQFGISGIMKKTPFLAETVKSVVFENFRGKGLGKLLSSAIEEECQRLGFKKVMTTIYEDNHQMIYIKLKQGYTVEGHHRDHEAPGLHEYSLGKILK